jgi:hypothetical protein
VVNVAVAPGFLFSRGIFGTFLVAGTLVLAFAVFLVLVPWSATLRTSRRGPASRGIRSWRCSAR